MAIDKDTAYAQPRLCVVEILYTDGTDKLFVVELNTRDDIGYGLIRVDNL